MSHVCNVSLWDKSRSACAAAPRHCSDVPGIRMTCACNESTLNCPGHTRCTTYTTHVSSGNDTVQIIKKATFLDTTFFSPSKKNVCAALTKLDPMLLRNLIVRRRHSIRLGAAMRNAGGWS